MNIEDFKKLSLLERLKVQGLYLDFATANSLLENAKARHEENLFLEALAGAIGKDRYNDKKDIYSQYFNELNIKSYTKQKGQSMGGKKSKRTAAKPKNNPDDINMKLNEV